MERNIGKITREIESVWKSRKFDPNGSYCGNADDKEKPIQDQDDLW